MNRTLQILVGGVALATFGAAAAFATPAPAGDPTPIEAPAPPQVPCNQTLADGSVYCGTPNISEPAAPIMLPAPQAGGTPTHNGLPDANLETAGDRATVTTDDGYDVETGIAEAAVLARATTEELNARYCAAKPWVCADAELPPMTTNDAGAAVKALEDSGETK